jgi:spore maturation protein CgeB
MPAEIHPSRPLLEPDLEVIPARSGAPTLVVRSDGRETSLHGRMDPEKEGRDLAAGFHPAPGRTLLFLGLGLGYHVRAALADLNSDMPVVVVEADPRILDTARSLFPRSDLWSRPRTHFLVGLSLEETHKELARIQIAYGFAGFDALLHPASARLRPDYYPVIKDQWTAAGPTPLRERLVRPRFRSAAHRLALLDTGYYVIREIDRAARDLGHDVHRIPIPDKKRGSDETIRRLLNQAADGGLDFVLTVNHLGFDADGVLADLLDRLELPWASWFVDSPRFILGPARDHGGGRGAVFLWDRDYMGPVQALGYGRVFYLPLGTDDTLFCPGQTPPTPGNMIPAGFVGDSMIRPVADKMAQLGLGDATSADVDRAALAFINSPDLWPTEVIEGLNLARILGLEPLSDQGRYDLESLVTWRATALYRLERVRALAGFSAVVAGDDGWRALLDGKVFDLQPSLDYYTELAGFYRRCRINLCATSLQMKTGLNQRVFDVPASGGFLLADYREQIEPLFEPGREVALYRDPEELADLARFYLNHDAERLKVAERGRARVLAEHTYRRRLAAMMTIMRKEFGS